MEYYISVKMNVYILQLKHEKILKNHVGRKKQVVEDYTQCDIIYQDTKITIKQFFNKTILHTILGTWGSINKTEVFDLVDFIFQWGKTKIKYKHNK